MTSLDHRDRERSRSRSPEGERERVDIIDLQTTQAVGEARERGRGGSYHSPTDHTGRGRSQGERERGVISDLQTTQAARASHTVLEETGRDKPVTVFYTLKAEGDYISTTNQTGRERSQSHNINYNC